jgi:hypothetical protein
MDLSNPKLNETQSRWWFDIVWIIAFGFFASIYAIESSKEWSTTFDETFYLQEALAMKDGAGLGNLMKAGTMPLPVYFQKWTLELFEWSRGTKINYLAEYTLALQVARLSALPFLWLMIICGYLIANKYGGSLAGKLAVGLIATEPTLLAHSALATTDVPLTALVLLYFLVHRYGRDKGFWFRVLLPGLMIGIATLSKASGWVFALLISASFELNRLIESKTFFPASRKSWWGWIRHLQLQSSPARWDYVWALMIGMSITFIGCGTEWKPLPKFVLQANQLPDGAFKSFAVWFAENLRVFPNAAEGLLFQIKHNMTSHRGTMIFDHWYPTSTVYYFPAGIAMKATLPTLLVVIMGLMVGRKKLWSPLGIIFVVLFLFIFTCRVQNGIRIVMPTIVFMILIGSVCFVDWLQRRKLLVQIISVVTLLSWSVILLIQIFPHSLCYFNPIAGGIEKGHLRMHDSNFDWGQGLPELIRWKDQHPGRPLYMWYFGTDPGVNENGLTHLEVHRLPLKVPEDLDEYIPPDAYLAVSASNLFGNPGSMRPEAISTMYGYQRLKQLTPFDRTTEFFIFDFQQGKAR